METKNQNVITPKLNKVISGLFPTAVSEEKLQEAREKAQKRIFRTSVVFHQTDGQKTDGQKTGQEGKALPEIVQAQIDQQYNKGLNFLSQAEGGNAVIAFSKAIILDSEKVELYVKRAEAFLLLCDFQSAALNLRKACSFNTVKEEYIGLLTFILFLQGQCLYDQESYLDALDSFTRASELQPWNSAYHLRSIACLAALGRHGDCLRLVNMQLQKEKQNADLYVLRARLHDHYRQVNLCFQDVKAALALEPDHSGAQALRGKLMTQAGEAKVLAISRVLEGKLHEALHKISLAIESQPSEAQYYVIRGAIYRRLQHFTAAIDDYLMALELSKDKETCTKAQTQLLLTYNDFAVNCYTKGFYKDGVLLLNKALKGQKQEPGLYINRGDCFFQLGEMTFALADYQQALELNPLDQIVWNRIGVVCNELGLQEQKKRKYQQAESYFSRAIEKQPYLPQYYWHRARVRRWLQDDKGAHEDAAIALLLNSDDKKVFPIATSFFPGKAMSEIANSEVGQAAKIILNKAVASPELPDSSKHETVWREPKIQQLNRFLYQNRQEKQELSSQVRDTEDNEEAQGSQYHFQPYVLDQELDILQPEKNEGG
ncbi:tetratricopeptide repeat protein 16 [Microcaecilia unicolor]|uniref:Tetratricopeptide repeat protein 16 n=1 Tax=Microcaecilia unicolor TaxID=1415580 RepID=A0A6P7Y8K4_9AMPH|nr:tetratricopeptide repeat protein 16 [Microcaecilia unicolor]XP_030063812.1 tetratricopeptide repeat protein 16 [Microcaecilia unicolor]